MLKSCFLVCVLIAILMVTGCGGGGGSISTVSPPVTPTQGNFWLNTNPPYLVLQAQTKATVQVTVMPENGFTGTVTITASGLPVGITADTITVAVSTAGQSAVGTMTLTAAPIAQGTYSTTLAGSSGTLNATTPLTVVVGPFDSFTLPAITEIAVRVGSPGKATLFVSGSSNYLVNFDASNLPAGVTASFTPSVAAPGQSVVLTVSADATAKMAQNISFKVTATRPSDSYQAWRSVLLCVAPPLGQGSAGRSDFLRTDGRPTSGVYDPVHKLLFMGNMNWNQVDVISTVSKKIVRTIPVPYPALLDLSVDQKTVFVGTWTRQLLAIDTQSLQIVARYMLPVISPAFQWSASFPRQMSDGSILLLASQYGSTATQLFRWDLVSNTTTALGGIQDFDWIAKSARGTRALVTSTSSSGRTGIYKVETGLLTTTDYAAYLNQAIAISPDGKQFLYFGDSALAAFNENFQRQFFIDAGGMGGRLRGAVYSGDGSRIYLMLNSDMTPTLVTVDALTGWALGTAPAIPLRPPHGDMVPPFEVAIPYGVDETGLVFGGTAHGVTFEDSTSFQNYANQAGSPIYNNFLTPTSGPVNVSTRINFWWGNVISLLSDVWFGDLRGLNPSIDTSLTPGVLYVDAPPSPTPGPVNVKLTEPNGVMIFNAQAFSYGPQVNWISGDTGSPAGGELAEIFGIGIPTDVSQVSMTIGGATAAVLSAKNIWYEHLPLVAVRVTVPPGLPGPADLKVTTSAGSFTVAGGFQYLRALNDYKSASNYQAVLYDRLRSRLYLSATDHVDVFSLATRSFLAPITIPTVNGKAQLGGMALTPDSSKLLVTNTADGSLAIVNVGGAGSTQLASITAPALDVNGKCALGPLTVAATNTAKALLFTGSAPAIACGPGGTLYAVDLSTLQVTQHSVSYLCGNAYLASNREGSKVATGGYNSGGFCLYDPATNTFNVADSTYVLGTPTAAGDGTLFGAGWKLFDADSTMLNRMALPDPLFNSATYDVLYGTSQIPSNGKLNASGSLMVVMSEHSVDIFDTAHGQPRRRIGLKQTVQNVTDALGINDDGSQIYLITDAGLTIAELDRLPLAFGSILPKAGVAGTQVTIRGSGFGPATVVSFNGMTAATTYVDGSTLAVVVPGVSAGPVQIAFSNDVGEKFAVDNAFTVH